LSRLRRQLARSGSVAVPVLDVVVVAAVIAVVPDSRFLIPDS
jgi:hypothetical protein